MDEKLQKFKKNGITGKKLENGVKLQKIEKIEENWRKLRNWMKNWRK